MLAKEAFGVDRHGREVTRLTLANDRGASVAISTLGAAITSIQVPDRAGQLDDVVLGFDALEGYLDHPHVGACIGRYAGRLRDARFELDGEVHLLAPNDRTHCLHGGPDGFDKAIWSVIDGHESPASLTLGHISPDGDQGFPGAISITVTYAIDDSNELSIVTEANADAPTVINITNHSYFNLAGRHGETIGAHALTIDAHEVVAIDNELVPTGTRFDVTDTPFDFRHGARIGDALGTDHEQLRRGYGFDHTFVLDAGADRVAARLHDPTSGRVLEVITDQPGLQLYTANGFGPVAGRGGRLYGRRAGVCLETQHFPDAPNHPDFPSVVLRPGQRFSATTRLRFSAE